MEESHLGLNISTGSSTHLRDFAAFAALVGLQS